MEHNGRNTDGTFKKGNRGKPKGALNNSTRLAMKLIQHKASEIVEILVNKAMAMRVAGILTRANWMRDGKFADSARRGLARYRNPDNLPLGEIGAGEEPDG